MWLLQWLPNWIFYAVLLVGVFGLVMSYFLRFIPFLYMYKTPIQIGSIATIVVGTFMSGAIYDNDAWEAKVKEMEAKVAAAETQSKEENVKIVEKVVTKTNVIREKGKDVVQYIDREVVKYDSKCEIPKEAVIAVNKAAEGVK